MFNLTEASIELMWKRCNYPIPSGGMAFFGLRGCLPVNYNGTDFAGSHEMNLHDVDYTHMRCTLGQWRPGHGFAVFPASTVPEGAYVRSRIPHGGYGANQLMLGCYTYRKGIHKPGKPTGHRAFRQHGFFPVWRTADDDDFDTADFVDMRSGFIAWDNLHCGWSNGPASPSYASVGCQVVAGFPKCVKRGASSRDEGPWKQFLDNAYAVNQENFRYALFSGYEAQSMAVVGSQQMRQSLRFGSHGEIVRSMQAKLNALGYDAGEVSGEFGFDSLNALMTFQKRVLGTEDADGIIGPMTADALGIDLPYLDGSVPAVALSGAVDGDEAVEGDDDDDADEAGPLRPRPDAEDDEAPLSFEISKEVDGGRTRYYAKANGTKVFIGRQVRYERNIGLTNIYDLSMTPAGVYDNNDAATRHGQWAHFIWPTAIGESKAHYACINTYDRARFTIGFSQLAAHTPDENLIVLYRRLLALPDAGRYFPDLTLVNGKVHQKLPSGGTRDLEVVTDRELKHFMAYLNPDLSAIDNAEVVSAARAFFGMMESEAHRELQIGLTIEIAKRKTKRAAQNGVPIVGRKLRYAIWVFDVLHQGRAGRGAYPKLKAAIESSNPERALMQFGMTDHEDRIRSVKASMDQLQSGGILDIDRVKYGSGEFA